LKDDRVVGLILWNVWNKVDDARRIIKSGRQFNNPDELKALITLEEEHH